MQKIDLLLQQLSGKEGGSSDVTAGVIKIRNKSHFHRIAANREHNRDRRGRRFGYF